MTDNPVPFKGWRTLRRFKAMLERLSPGDLKELAETVADELGQAIGAEGFRHSLVQFTAVMEELHNRERKRRARVPAPE